MELEITNLSENKKVDLERWAKYVVEKFEFAITKYRTIKSADLLRSFIYSVSQEAGGDNAIISFAFNYYLRMIDMGVGRGTKYEDTTTYNNDTTHKNRTAKPVYNKILWGETNKLKELLNEYYLQLGLKIIITRTD